MFLSKTEIWSPSLPYCIDASLIVFTLFHVKLKVSIHDYFGIGHFKKKTTMKTKKTKT